MKNSQIFNDTSTEKPYFFYAFSVNKAIRKEVNLSA